MGNIGTWCFARTRGLLVPCSKAPFQQIDVVGSINCLPLRNKLLMDHLLFSAWGTGRCVIRSFVGLLYFVLKSPGLKTLSKKLGSILKRAKVHLKFPLVWYLGCLTTPCARTGRILSSSLNLQYHCEIQQ